jgi:hypothetical protein
VRGNSGRYAPLPQFTELFYADFGFSLSDALLLRALKKTCRAAITAVRQPTKTTSGSKLLSISPDRYPRYTITSNRNVKYMKTTADRMAENSFGLSVRLGAQYKILLPAIAGTSKTRKGANRSTGRILRAKSPKIGIITKRCPARNLSIHAATPTEVFINHSTKSYSLPQFRKAGMV